MKEWSAWLREETRSWILRNSGDPSRPAFSPLFISRTDSDPGATLASEIRKTCSGRTNKVESAACDVIASWSLEQDGVQGAVLLIRFATRLVAHNLYSAVRTLIRGRPILSLTARELLAAAIVSTAEACFTSVQKRTMATQLEEQNILTPFPAAALAAAISVSAPRNAPSVIARYGRTFASQKFEIEGYQHFVAKLLERYPIDVLRRSWLSARKDESVEIVRIRQRLRRALLQFDSLSVEKADVGETAAAVIIHAEFGSPAGRRRADAMEARVGERHQ